MVTFPVLLDINAETKLCGFCEPASHKSVTSQSQVSQPIRQQASKQAAIIIRSSGDSSDGGDSKAVAANEAHRQTNRHKQSQAQHSTVQHSTHTDKHAYHSSGSVKRREIQNACISLHRCAETSATAAASNSDSNSA